MAETGQQATCIALGYAALAEAIVRQPVASNVLRLVQPTEDLGKCETPAPTCEAVSQGETRTFGNVRIMSVLP